MKKLIILVLLLSLVIVQSHAQDDSVKVVTEDGLIVESADTIAITSYAARYNPRKALLYAAVLPGLGQIYNKKYWKLPLVYGGFYALGSGINHYNNLYKLYKKELYYNLENGYEEDTERRPGDIYTTRTYRNATNQARRNRDFMVILMGAMYLIQVIDAHVDAHLKEFDLNPNLQVSLEPTLEQNAMLGTQKGLSLVIRF